MCKCSDTCTNLSDYDVMEKLKEINRWCMGSLKLISHSSTWELTSYDPTTPLYHVKFSGEDLKEIIDKAYDFVVNKNILVINTKIFINL